MLILLASCSKTTSTESARGVDSDWLSEMEHDSILLYYEKQGPNTKYILSDWKLTLLDSAQSQTERAVYSTTLCNRDYRLDSLHWSILIIDGAMSMQADVYVNGEEVCYWPLVRGTFDCYLTPFLYRDSTTIDIYLENKPRQSHRDLNSDFYLRTLLISTDSIPTEPDNV